MKKLYRARGVVSSDPYNTRRILVDELFIVAETEFYYWCSFFRHNPAKQKKVSKNGTKPFAYPTKKQALESFLIRQKHRIGWGEYHIQQGEAFSKICEKQLKELAEALKGVG